MQSSSLFSDANGGGFFRYSLFPFLSARHQ
jgi:hypothetical protein